MPPEDPRHVDVDRHRGERLRRQEQENSERIGSFSRASVAGRHRERECDDDRRHRDQTGSRRHCIAGRAEDLLPVAGAVGEGARVPALGNRPQRQIGKRTDQREGEGRENNARQRGAQQGRDAAHGALSFAMPCLR
jgi:hypothetical protein